MSTSLRTTRSEHDPDRTAVGVEIGNGDGDEEDKGREVEKERGVDEEREREEEEEHEHEHEHDQVEGNDKEDVPSPLPWERHEPPTVNKSTRMRSGLGLVVDTTRLGNGNHQVVDVDTRPLVPKSSYYFGPPPVGSAFGTQPVGQIGVHHPREVLRVERDYTGGEVIQFAPIYLMELEGRITPTQFLETINTINEILISASSLRRAALDNTIAVLSLQLSHLVLKTHYEKEMERLKAVFGELNERVWWEKGLSLRWPGDVAWLFMEIEYY